MENYYRFANVEIAIAIPEYWMYEEEKILAPFRVEHLLMESSEIILHSSYVSYKNHAILFTAPSGTGKSTQATSILPPVVISTVRCAMST